MESRSRFAVVASLSLLLTSVGAQMAPAPGPMPQDQSGQGLINGAPVNMPNMHGGANAPGPQPMPMPMQTPPTNTTTPVTTPGGTVTTTPSSPQTSPSPPSTTSPPVNSAPAPPTVVAFVTKLSVDTPNTFYNTRPDGVNTIQQLWCRNLVGNSGAICSATATAGSVNVDTVLTYPPTQAAASAATSLTNTLQAIANNPSNANLVATLIPVIPGVNTSSYFGFEGVSGIQTQTLSLGPVGSPYRAPAMAPALAPTVTPRPPILFSFVIRLGLATPADFTPALRTQWCNRLLANTNGANCTITSVAPGSIIVVTEMSYAATDAASEGALASRLQAIQSGNSAQANTLFGSDFGNIEVLSIGTSAVPPPPPPPASTKHHLSGGKIAGAVIGSVAGAAILGGCGFAGYKYYHTRRAYQPAV